MSYNLDFQVKREVIASLCEGASIRSVERMTGVHRDTIMRLGVRVGEACAEMLDKTMRDLEIDSVQIDELWTFIGKKKQNMRPFDPGTMGDCYTFFAIDAESKIIPSYACGKRNMGTVEQFISDLASRLKNRPQINSDGFLAYASAIKQSFGDNVDYGMIVKTFVDDRYAKVRNYSTEYEPARVAKITKTTIQGNPDHAKLSTSYVERHNLTARTMNKRLTRLSLAFSKKLENFVASIGLYVAYYNFCKTHSTLKATPAEAYGLTNHRWSAVDLVALSE